MPNQKTRSPFRYALIASIALHVMVGVWAIRYASVVTTPPEVTTMPIVLTSASPKNQAVPNPSPVPPRQPIPAQPPTPQKAPQEPPSTIARSTAANVPPSVAATPLASETPAPVAPTGKTQQAEPVFSAPEYNAAYLHNPRPGYPPRARKRGQEGTTFLAVRVGTNGRALSIEISRSSGVPELDEAAREAVRGWTFVPAKKGTQPVEGFVEVPLHFHITN
jgi:protein TonB